MSYFAEPNFIEFEEWFDTKNEECDILSFVYEEK